MVEGVTSLGMYDQCSSADAQFPLGCTETRNSPAVGQLAGKRWVMGQTMVSILRCFHQSIISIALLAQVGGCRHTPLTPVDDGKSVTLEVTLPPIATENPIVQEEAYILEVLCSPDAGSYLREQDHLVARKLMRGLTRDAESHLTVVPGQGKTIEGYCSIWLKSSQPSNAYAGKIEFNPQYPGVLFASPLVKVEDGKLAVTLFPVYKSIIGVTP